MQEQAPTDWPVPLAVIFITLNEAHNMREVLENVSGWAQEVHILDSYSNDATVDIALDYNVHVSQRSFRGFGDQWNFALNALQINAPWTMKLDPDERLTPELKSSIRLAIERDNVDGLIVQRRLWFMGAPMQVRQNILRVWRSGSCKFSDVLVNEHPLVTGQLASVRGDLEHHDSPNLHHWIDKQNKYSTSEALTLIRGLPLSAVPSLFGSKLQRQMWLKSNYHRIPFCYALIFLHALLIQGALWAGTIGIIWARLRSEVYRMRDIKFVEMRLTGREYTVPQNSRGNPHPRARQLD